MATLPLFTSEAYSPVDVSRDTWATPRSLGRGLVKRFHCDLDVAAAPHNALCRRFYTREDNGLTSPWNGIVWCNPPYSDPLPWVKKAIEESRRGLFRAVMLLPLSGGTEWYRLCLLNAERWDLDERVQFVAPPETKKSTNTHGSFLAVFGYGYAPMWRGVLSHLDGSTILDVGRMPQRQRAR